MKNNMIRFVLCLTSLAAGTQLFGQSASKFRVSVPFEFTVSGIAMPAGAYAVEEVGIGGAVCLRSLGENAKAVYVMPKPASGAFRGPGLVFQRRNGTPVLTRITGDLPFDGSLPARR